MQIMLYRDIYDHWRKILVYEVLPPLVEQKISDYYMDGKNRRLEPNKEVRILWALGFTDSASTEILTVADYLVRATKAQSERSIIQGRRVALLENGIITFVPARAEKGDLLFATNLHPTFVILRGYKGPVDMTVESSLRSYFNADLKSGPVPAAPWPRLPQIELLPIRHYTLVGDCFVNIETSPREVENKGQRRDHHIVALH